MPEGLKLYLDQMLRLDVGQALRGEGHDVMRASEVGQARADDEQILQQAISENRILVTLDEDFGDWVILPLSQHPGVIRLKVSPKHLTGQAQITRIEELGKTVGCGGSPEEPVRVEGDKFGGT